MLKVLITYTTFVHIFNAIVNGSVMREKEKLIFDNKSYVKNDFLLIYFQVIPVLSYNDLNHRYQNI